MTLLSPHITCKFYKYTLHSNNVLIHGFIAIFILFQTLITSGFYSVRHTHKCPTMQYPDKDTNTFYSQLRTAIDGVLRKDKLIILGDFNARVGADWPALEGVGETRSWTVQF